MANTISATQLKNKVSEVLNSVYFSGEVTIVEKYGKPIAEISPIKGVKKSKEEIKKVLDATFGSLPDFPDVRASRYFRKRTTAFK